MASLVIGGFPCCVPGCFSNSKSDKTLLSLSMLSQKKKELKGVLVAKGFEG